MAAVTDKKRTMSRLAAASERCRYNLPSGIAIIGEG